MGNFGRRMNNFMSGRYGTDAFSAFLLVFGLVISIVGSILMYFTPIVIPLVLYALAWILLGYGIFRSYSRKIYKRRAENAVFLKCWGKVISPFRLMKNKIRDRKTHVYRKCPKCKAVLRLPKKIGKHTVKCPKCLDFFNVRVR